MIEWWIWHRSHTLACFRRNFVSRDSFTDLTAGKATVRTVLPRLHTVASRIKNCSYRKIITYQTPQWNLPNVLSTLHRQQHHTSRWNIPQKRQKHGGCIGKGYSSVTQLSSNLVCTYFLSVARSFWNFAHHIPVILPCLLHANLKTNWQ